MRSASSTPLILVFIIAGCSSGSSTSGDTGTDTQEDTAADTSADVPPDAPADTSADTGADPLPDTSTDPAVDTTTDPTADTMTDTIADTYPDTTTDPTTDPGCDPCYVRGSYVPGCTAMCGGFAGTPCPDTSVLTCVYAAGSDAGICIPTANLSCSVDADCVCFPHFSICTTTSWTCSAGSCAVACI